jgi:hypothetical protein
MNRQKSFASPGGGGMNGDFRILKIDVHYIILDSVLISQGSDTNGFGLE